MSVLNAAALVAVAVAAAVGAAEAAVPLGTGVPITRSYGQYVDLPPSAEEAVAAGWQRLNETGCNKALGVGYVMPVSAAETAQWHRQFGSSSSGGAVAPKKHPITLFFTPAGQPSGMGMTLYGSAFPNLVQKGFLLPVAGEKDVYELDVAFRAPGGSGACASGSLPEALGDRLVVSPAGANYEVPIVAPAATALKYQNGSCFEYMGWHAFHWLTPDGSASWAAEDLMPIIPMYAGGRLNAFFFASATVQQAITGAHWWDPIPLENILMCKNWCDKSCTFTGTHFWSTAHMFLGPGYKNVECPQKDCTISCCDA